jgi:pimeloyl-ACP methyl ester carboxylesterase
METLHTFSASSSAGPTLAYRDVGSGQALVLVHAFPLHSAMWHPQIAALSQHYRLIMPDMRGFGASDLGQPPTTLSPYADDLLDLLDHLGLGQVVMGGLSMGSYIALEFVRRHATRLAALILADTRAGADSDDGKRGRETNARLAESAGVPAVGEAMLPRMIAPNAPEALRTELRRIMAENTPAGTVAALRSMAARPDSTDLLATIAIPTLIIVGAEDLLTPPAEARHMHAAIPGSQLIEIPGIGHLSNLEAPAAFNSAVQSFLAS